MITRPWTFAAALSVALFTSVLPATATAAAQEPGQVQAPSSVPGQVQAPSSVLPPAQAPQPVQVQAQAQQNRRGPDPTYESISAERGPFATQTVGINDAQTPESFGGAALSFPTDRSQGRFGVVAIAPGRDGYEPQIAPLRDRIASQGFAVITINTKTPVDEPPARGQQLLDALDFVVNRSVARDRIDPSRQAVMGYSFGGGGALYAASQRRELQAAISLNGFSFDPSFPQVRAATLLISGQNDDIAATAGHSGPFYASMDNAEERALLELSGADHFTPLFPNTKIARKSITWLKRFVDNDTRYERFICPGPSGEGAGYSAVRLSCPLG